MLQKETSLKLCFVLGKLKEASCWVVVLSVLYALFLSRILRFLPVQRLFRSLSVNDFDISGAIFSMTCFVKLCRYFIDWLAVAVLLLYVCCCCTSAVSSGITMAFRSSSFLWGGNHCNHYLISFSSLAVRHWETLWRGGVPSAQGSWLWLQASANPLWDLTNTPPYSKNWRGTWRCVSKKLSVALFDDV